MSNGPTDPFAEACGLPGTFRVELEGPSSEGSITREFHQPFLVIGRDPLADLTIDDADVSPRHAYLQVIGGRVFCLNIGSRSGIHWEEGPRLASWVDGGNGIRIGPVQLRFPDAVVGKGGSLPISEEFDGSSPAIASHLEFLGDDASRKPWPITRALSLLGSSPTCRVHLPGAGVGRMHAALLRTPAGIWVVDLLGPGGIMVRDASTRHALLGDGDEIAIGPHRMRYMLGPVPETLGRTELARRTAERFVQPIRKAPEPTPSVVAEEVESTITHESSLPISLDQASTNKLLEEFDRMHQRTVDQFQQAIMMMFRMHQEQMDSVRDELSRLDRLEEEQKALRSEIARNAAPPTNGSGFRKDAGEAAPRPRARTVEEAPPQPTELPEWKTPNAPMQGPATIPTNGHAAEHAAMATNGHPAAGHPTDSDPHSRLARRIAEIHNERQGLWKRIMASLSGDTSEMRLP